MLHIHNLMGQPSYMGSVFDRNVGMRRMVVTRITFRHVLCVFCYQADGRKEESHKTNERTFHAPLKIWYERRMRYERLTLHPHSVLT
jgi:hypothetical protein